MNPAYQKINKSYNRTIIIGDIHGCYEEMRELLNRISFGSNDLLIAVGDLVDRGPYSWQVASFFKNTENAYSVLGNHERRVAGVIRGTSQPAWSQLHTLSKLNEDEHGPWADYFESLPAIIETPHAIVAHARMDPDEKVTEQDPYHTCGVGCAHVGIEVDETGTPRWFHQWRESNYSSKPLCIGHIDYKNVELEAGGLFALDTSAAKGHQLSAVVFPEAAVVSVDCHDYYSESRKEWREQESVRKLEELHHRPLHELTKLLRNEQHDKHDLGLINKLHLLLDEYEFESRFALLRDDLISTFGEFPSVGAERGDYVKEIRSHFDSSKNQRLIGMLITDKPFQLEQLMKIFQKSTLNDVASIYANIEAWLCDMKIKV